MPQQMRGHTFLLHKELRNHALMMQQMAFIVKVL